MAIDWQHIQANWDWLGHILEGAVMSGITALLFRIAIDRRTAFLMGVAFAVGHFHGREKRDYEVSVSMPPPHLDAYMMWHWSKDQATDFWPVALVGILALALVVWGGRRRLVSRN